jgi:hypothetical protein
MCSLQVESLSQEDGYDGLKFVGKGGKPADIPLPVPVMRAVRVVVNDRTTGPLLRNRAGHALTTLDARRMVNRIASIAGCRHITPHGCLVPGLMEALNPREDESHGSTEEVPGRAPGAGDPDGR